MKVLKCHLLCGFVLAACCLPGPGIAAERATAPASALESYIDGIMEKAIVSGVTVGATVALVQDGRLLTARGYGYADLEAGVPVQARLSSFRIGSVTKVLAWMSVLQQVEAGRVRLDADVNSYLRRFQMSTAFTEPVTLRHLMTHTAGFEDDLTRLFVSGPRQLGSLADNLQNHVPARLRLPGTAAAYSNYGAALAAHIVANVTEQDWHDYVQVHLLQPMRMRGASTRQPLPERLMNNRARGYVRGTDGFTEQSFSYIPLAPAGAASATALDMARLMVELLNPSSTGILSAQSKALLLNGAYIVDPRVNGMTLGMYQMTQGGARAVGHDGSTMLFHSRMILWPDEKLGLFVSFNTDTSAALVGEVVNTIAAHMGLATNQRLPAANRADDGQAREIDNGTQYNGMYVTTRRNVSNFTKLLALVDTAQVSYERLPELLRVQDITGVRRYRLLGEGVFEQVAGTARLVFTRTGKDLTLYMSERPMVAYLRAEGEQTPAFSAYLLGMWLLLALSVLIFWPVASLARLFGDAATTNSGGGMLLSVCVVGSIFLVLAFFLHIAGLAGNQVEFVFTGFTAIAERLWIPALFIVLVLIQLGYLYRVWVTGLWWPARRWHFTVFLFAQVALAWWFWYWRLLPPAVLEVLA